MAISKPRQNRSEETLRRILSACDRLIAKRPFEQISMQDIASEAGVSVGNLYNRFSDKDGLVNHVIADHQARFRETMIESLAALPPDLDTRSRLAAIVDISRRGMENLGPVFATVAARLARGEAPMAAVSGNSEDLVDRMSDWLADGDASLAADRCRFAVSSVLFGLQFNLLFGTADRLFGDAYTDALVEQAHCYLTCNHD